MSLQEEMHAIHAQLVHEFQYVFQDDGGERRVEMKPNVPTTEVLKIVQQALCEAEGYANELSSDVLVQKMDAIIQHLLVALEDFTSQSSKIMADPNLHKRIAECSLDEDSLESTSALHEWSAEEQSARALVEIASEAAREAKDALESIEREEIELVARVIVRTFQTVVPMSRRLVETMIGQNEKDRASRIFIEEIDEEKDQAQEEEENTTKAFTKKKRVVYEAIQTGWNKVIQKGCENPFTAGFMTVLCSPLVVLLLPVGSIAAAGLIAEEVAPEYTATALDILRNTIQLLQLWLLLARLMIRRCSKVGLRVLHSIYTQACQDGLYNTSKQAMVNGYHLSLAAYQHLCNFLSNG